MAMSFTFSFYTCIYMGVVTDMCHFLENGFTDIEVETIDTQKGT